MKNVFVLIIIYSGNIDEVRVYDNMPTLMEYLDTCDNNVRNNLKMEDNKDFDTGHIIYTTEINNIGITTTTPSQPSSSRFKALGYVPIVVQRHITEDIDLV